MEIKNWNPDQTLPFDRREWSKPKRAARRHQGSRLKSRRKLKSIFVAENNSFLILASPPSHCHSRAHTSLSTLIYRHGIRQGLFIIGQNFYSIFFPPPDPPPLLASFVLESNSIMIDILNVSKAAIILEIPLFFLIRQQR